MLIYYHLQKPKLIKNYVQRTTRLKKVKGLDITFYIPPQETLASSGLQIILTGNDRSGAAQVAAAHCPNERTLDPIVCSQTDPPMPQPAALWPSPRNVLWQ